MNWCFVDPIFRCVAVSYSYSCRKHYVSFKPNLQFQKGLCEAIIVTLSSNWLKALLRIEEFLTSLQVLQFNALLHWIQFPILWFRPFCLQYWTWKNEKVQPQNIDFGPFLLLKELYLALYVHSICYTPFVVLVSKHIKQSVTMFNNSDPLVSKRLFV